MAEEERAKQKRAKVLVERYLAYHKLPETAGPLCNRELHRSWTCCAYHGALKLLLISLESEGENLLSEYEAATLEGEKSGIPVFCNLWWEIFCRKYTLPKNLVNTLFSSL